MSENLQWKQLDLLENISSSDAPSQENTTSERIGQKRIDVVTCKVCEITQPVHNFEITATGEIKRKCKSCKNGQMKVLRKLRKENPYPNKDYHCPVCKRHMDEVNKYKQPMLKSWVLDHCHLTDTFRGWICQNCNAGLGGFRDNSQTVLSAHKYLEDHYNKLSTGALDV